MDLASILAALGINPATISGLGQDAAGMGKAVGAEAASVLKPAPLPPNMVRPVQNAQDMAMPIPAPMDLAATMAPANRPLPFGTEQGNAITGLPAAPAPNAPLQQIPLANDKQWPPQNTPESDQMKQAMLMIQAALDPDTIAAKADAAGIPPPDAGSLMGAEGWHNGEQTAVPGMPAPAAPAGAMAEFNGFPGRGGGVAPLPVPIPGATLPEVGPELAGSLISKPAQVTAEAAAASQPVVPVPVAKPVIPAPGTLQVGGGTPPVTSDQPAAAASIKENLKKALSGVQNPGGKGSGKGVGSAGIIAPKDFDSVAAFLAQVMSGAAMPQPAKLPFL